MDERRTYQGGTAALVADTGAASASAVDDRNETIDITDAGNTAPSGAAPDAVPLLDAEKAERFRRRWEEYQRGFVDEPRRSVEMADQLVADLVRDLAAQFANERAQLESQWSRGEEVSTDDLRFALQRYRAFFNRLLKV